MIHNGEYNRVIAERDEAREALRDLLMAVDALQAAAEMDGISFRDALAYGDSAIKRANHVVGRTPREGDEAVPVHGSTCSKEPHDDPNGGYLRGSEDDGPYDVDGVRYCGRCHCFLDSFASLEPRGDRP